MLMLCWTLRPFIVLGAVPALLIGAIALSNFSHDPGLSTAILTFTTLYFCLAYLVFIAVPRTHRNRLEARVQSFKARGFTPKLEVFSLMHNRYAGFDSSNQQALYVDLGSGSEMLIPFADMDRWELKYAKPYPIIKIYSQVPIHRGFGIRVSKTDAGPLESALLRVLPSVSSRTLQAIR